MTTYWNAEVYDRIGKPMRRWAQEVIRDLALRGDETVLDAGCGSGSVTFDLLQQLPRGKIYAVDASADMIAKITRSIEEQGIANACPEPGRRVIPIRADLTDFELPEQVDCVFSNAVLHWIPDAGAVIASVHRALKPGGRFVAEFGGAGCVQTVRLALVDAANRRGLDGAALDPWYFPTDAAYRALLEAHGFIVRAITLFPRLTPLPGDITDWLETFAQPFLVAVPEHDRPAFVQDVRSAVQPALFDPARGWSADYIRLRFAAVKSK